MDDKESVLQPIMSILTYVIGGVWIGLTFVGHYAGVFLGVVGSYAPGFSVVCMCITCVVNWHYQRVRTRLAKARVSDDSF
jgi:uncharacterized membrane protein